MLTTKRGTGLLLAALLAVPVLVFAFRHGAYQPATWLPVSLAASVLGIALLALPFREPLPRTSWLPAGALAALAALAALSLTWSASPFNAWQETNRTMMYLMGFLLALAASCWLRTRPLQVFEASVLIAVGIVAGVILLGLGGVIDVSDLVYERRLYYPLSYSNGLAALLTIGFWLALGLSVSRRIPGWAVVVLTAGAVGLAQLALLPQSRGALYGSILMAPVFLALSSHRFRALWHFSVVTVAILVGWDALMSIWRAADLGMGQDQAAHRVAIAVVSSMLAGSVAAGLGLVVERRLAPLGDRYRKYVGVALISIAVLAIAAGLVWADRATGGLPGFLGDRWEELASDHGPTEQYGSRFREVGLDHRLGLWRSAWRAFADNPLLGVGAQNFQYYHYEHGGLHIVQQPHSHPLQVLSELGLAGTAAFAALLLWIAYHGLRLRFSAHPSVDPAAVVAALTVSGYWIIHASADWLWQLAAVTWPVVVLWGSMAALPREEAAGLSSTEEPSPAGSWARRLDTRAVTAAIAVVALLSAAFPYAAIRLLDTAEDNIPGSPSAVVTATDYAATLNPLSPEPWNMRARLYETLARDAAPNESLGYRALAVSALERAIREEPHSWLQALKAAEATADLLAATQAREGQAIDPAELEPPDEALSGRAASLARTSNDELLALAREHLADAQRLNPGSEAIPLTVDELLTDD